MSVAVISISRNLAPSSCSPAMPSIISDVARRCFIELGVSLAIGAVSFFFTANLLHGALLFIAIAVQTICNAALRFAEAIALKEPNSKECQWVVNVSRYLYITSFAYLTAVNAQTLIHESGHAIAAKACYQNANPRITLTPCLGGVTHFNASQLSKWGEQLGTGGSLALITLSGPAATLFVSGIAVAIGLAVQSKFPELGHYLIGVGRGDFYAHSFYALTALCSSPPTTTHDFIRLRRYGIHPLVSAGLILTIPFLITRIFQRVEKTAENNC